MVKLGVLCGRLAEEDQRKMLSNISGFELIGFFHTESGIPSSSYTPGTKSFTSVDQLLRESDAIQIADSAYKHFPHIKQAIKDSKHLLVQNPFTEHLEGVNELITLASEARSIIQLTQTERFNSALMAVHPYIKRPRYIEFRQKIPYPEAPIGKFSLVDHMIHDIDLAIYLCRSNVKRIHISGIHVANRFPDLIESRLEFDNGCIINFLINRITSKHEHNCRIFQEGSQIIIDLLNQEAEVIHAGRKKRPLTEGEDPLHEPEITSEKLLVTPINPKEEELISFHTSIERRSYPQVDLDDAVKAVSIALELQAKLDRLMAK
jgi:predicted dehydrogenase